MKASLVDTDATFTVTRDHLWTNLQSKLRRYYGDSKLRLVRISRDDHGCSYCSPGEYTIAFHLHGWEETRRLVVAS